jgi:hypothetical protein
MRRLLILFLLIWFVNYCFAQDVHNGKHELVYRSNKFVLEPIERDTVTVVDPITGTETMHVRDPIYFPVTMNGKHIYSGRAADIPSQSRPPYEPLEEQILNNLKHFYDSLCVPDGTLRVRLKQVIIDGHGKIVYSDFSGVNFIGEDRTTRVLISPETDYLFANVSVVPATYHNQDVSTRRIFLSSYLIEIKDHKMVYRRM